MKKIFFLFSLIFLTVTPVRPITTDTITDLTHLAQYYPATSPFYVSFYIDDETIDTLDVPLNQIIVNLGYGGFVGGKGPIRFILDYAADDDFEGATFNDIYRPWIGNTLAIGAMTPETMVFDDRDDEWLAVVEVRDRDLAEQHLDKVIATGEGIFSYFRNYVKDEIEGYPFYRPTNSSRSQTTILLMDDVILVRYSSVEPEAIIPNYEQNLAEIDGFEGTFRRLPLDEYMLISYYDPSAFAPYAEEYDEEIQVSGIFSRRCHYLTSLISTRSPSIWLHRLERIRIGAGYCHACR